MSDADLKYPLFVYCKTHGGKVFPQKWMVHIETRTEKPLMKWSLGPEDAKLSLLKLSEIFPYQPPPQEPKFAIDSLYI